MAGLIALAVWAVWFAGVLVWSFDQPSTPLPLDDD